MQLFTRPVFHISRLKNTLLEDTDGKGKFKRRLTCSFFLLVDKGGLFFTNCPSRNSKFTTFSSQPIEWLACFETQLAMQPSSEVLGEFSGTFCTV